MGSHIQVGYVLSVPSSGQNLVAVTCIDIYQGVAFDPVDSDPRPSGACGGADCPTVNVIADGDGGRLSPATINFLREVCFGLEGGYPQQFFLNAVGVIDVVPVGGSGGLQRRFHCGWGGSGVGCLVQRSTAGHVR